MQPAHTRWTITHFLIDGVFANDFVLLFGEEHVGTLEAFGSTRSTLVFGFAALFPHGLVVCVVSLFNLCWSSFEQST